MPISLNCTNFTVEQFRQLDLARGLSGATCLLVCIVAFLLVLLYKAYKTTLQRLFLYLTAATCFYLSTIVLQIEHLFHYAGQEDFCVMLGFFVQWTGSTALLFSFVITLFVLYKVFEQVRGEVCSSVARSKRCRIALETVTVSIAIFLPPAVGWVPFIRGTYGLAGAWCWIRTINNDCSDAGFWDQTILYYIPLAIASIFNMVASVVIAGIFCISACAYKETRHKHAKRVRETVILLAFFLAFALISSAEIAARMYTGLTHKREYFGMWMAYAIGTAIAKLIFPIAFLVYLYSLKKLG